MIRRRIDVEAKLHGLSVLHIGAGWPEGPPPEQPLPDTGSADDQTLKAEVRTIQRDGAGYPWIPGSSLKGTMRRLLAPGVAADRLFGLVKMEGGGVESLVRVFGAAWVNDEAPSVADRPYAATWGRAGTYLSAQTTVDPASGVADDHKLYWTELAPEGAVFRFRASLLWSAGRSADGDQRDLDDFVQVLAGMAHADGFQIGAGAADGYGRMRLLPDTLNVEERHLRQEDGLVRCASPAPLARRVADALAKPTAATATTVLRLHLKPKGLSPFAILDSSHRTDDSLDPGDPGRVQLRAQRRRNGDGSARPLVQGPSLMGALRARCDWLQRLHDLRSGQNGRPPIGEPALLELFGHTRQRARLRLRTLSVLDGSREQRLTSVKIDRFSGAPIDGDLFTIDAFCNVQMVATLEIDPVSEPASRLADLLWEDLGRRGLSLGHGASRGFGWLSVDRIQGSGEAA
jgi:CRISPR/Cas system CSM-associated protein Csm3 (group 7 of RAMP superfamily)